jgi:isopenicillin N synthase-like dioxygenase
MTEAISFDAVACGEAAAATRLSQDIRARSVCFLDPSDVLGACYSQLFSVALEFFRLPLELKREVDLASSGNLRGYVGFGAERTNGAEDLKESFEFAQDRFAPTHRKPRPYDRLYGSNLWPAPSRVPGFEATLKRYNDAMELIGSVVLKALVAALEDSGTGPSRRALLRGRPCHFSRLIYYSHPSAFAPSDNRLVAHTDHAFFALGLQSAPGFEFCDASGRWILADPPPGSAMLFAGELADFWSAGRYPACPHRVRNATLQLERISVTTFFLPDLDAVVSPIGSNSEIAESILVGDREWARMQAIFPVADHNAP